MANDETPAGFLSRWSRRKAEVRHGVALVDAGNSSYNQGKKLGALYKAGWFARSRGRPNT